MRLVIFTAHYPYGMGEVFLENELRVAENHFDEILIVTNAKPSESISRYLPSNSKVIHLRKNTNAILCNIGMLQAFFIPKYWKEFIEGCKERGKKHMIEIALKLMRNKRYFRALKRYKKSWIGFKEQLKDTIFYSYWFGPTVLFFKWNNISEYRCFVSRAHGGDCFYDRGYMPWRKESLDAIDAVFPISEMGCRDIITHYNRIVPKLNTKLYVSRLGVNLPTEVGPVPRVGEPAIIVSCSNVIGLKRLDLIIEALREWNSSYVRWIHFGDGILMEEIRNQAQKELGENLYVNWEFRGRVDNNEVLRFYRNTPITLFVNCSDVEGIPVAAMEAMSYGIPVLARNVGGLSELVDDSCGELLPAEASVDALMCSMHKLIEEQTQQTREEMRINARYRVEKLYSSKKNYELFWMTIKGITKYVR